MDLRSPAMVYGPLPLGGRRAQERRAVYEAARRAKEHLRFREAAVGKLAVDNATRATPANGSSDTWRIPVGGFLHCTRFPRGARKAIRWSRSGGDCTRR